MSYTKLILHKADNFTTTSASNWALYTKPSGTFTNTETSMYAEVIGLASSTYYGGASLGNQSERYLLAMAVAVPNPDDGAQGNYNHYGDGTNHANDLLGAFPTSSYTYSPSGHDSFTAIQSSLEDDGKHFVEVTGSNSTFSILIVDKNNLTSGGSGTGTTVDGYNWDTAYTADSSAYGAWDFTDPDFPTTVAKVNKLTDKIDREYKNLTTNDYFSSKDSQITAFLLQQLYVDQGRTVIDKLKKFGEVNNNDHYTNI